MNKVVCKRLWHWKNFWRPGNMQVFQTAIAGERIQVLSRRKSSERLEMGCKIADKNTLLYSKEIKCQNEFLRLPRVGLCV